MPTLTERFKNAWSAFTSRDPTADQSVAYGNNYSPFEHYRNPFYGDQSIITMVKERIAVDVSQIDIKHIKTDDNGNYLEDMDSGLNNALTLDANVDQTGRCFIKDAVMSMFDEGHVALVPVDTDVNPLNTDGYDVLTLRTGRVLDWFPAHVRVEVFNENTARKEDVLLPKRMVAIIENPFYSIMNEPNSTLKRLVRTLHKLDMFNEANTPGKLDLIIQLPYSLRSPVKQQQAEGRRKQLEKQMAGAKYGIGYIDAAEHVTQLNRPVDNNLWVEARELTSMLFNQLGLTQGVFDGTADEKAMNNYYNRTVEPILTALTEEMERKFLSKTARTRHQKVVYIRDPFKLATLSEIAETANTFITDQIMTSNEVRARLGMPPADTPQADELVNPNINKISDTVSPQSEETNQNEEETEEVTE